MPPALPALRRSVDAVRGFNRFYTRFIGTLNEGLLDTSYSLAEARVLYELAHRPGVTAKVLAEILQMDEGYLSRILRQFENKGLVSREVSRGDGRQSLIRFTRVGRREFDRLDKKSNHHTAELLQSVDPHQWNRLTSAMQTIHGLLDPDGGKTNQERSYVLRPHRPGDLGWIVHRHGVLYAREYGFDDRFEALVARIVADFVDQYDDRRERCWIAESGEEIVGSVLLVKHPESPETIARLRLLLVEPSARGMGIGHRLVSECSRFARSAGYLRISLWTNDVLKAARRVYEAEGYRLVSENKHQSFGRDLVGQTWELDLQSSHGESTVLE